METESTKRSRRPVILAVDDDEGVLGALARDLRTRYGRRYRVHRAASAAAALAALRTLRLRGEPVALVLADQRMPGASGLDLLRDATAIHPHARRVLLTAYADNEVAIRAINEIRLDHYLMKPWAPPEQHLHPVLDDLLDEWQAGHASEAAGIRVVGHRWSAEGHRIRDFLARNLTPFRWLEADADPEADRLLEAAGAREPALPLVLLPDGRRLERPDVPELAAAIGLRADPLARVYDLVIVGGGPAGLAAAVYGSSEGLSTLLLEREAPGGQAGSSARIENYLGFPAGLSGGELARRAVAQARRFGTEILTPVEVVGLHSAGGYHTVRLGDGSELSGRALLVATGVRYRTLDVPGAARLTGAGIYYGAAQSEALALSGEDVFVLGGGNSAGQAAVFLARTARTVTLLVRERSLAPTMSRYLITQLERTANVRVRTSAAVEQVHGSERLSALSLRDRASGALESVPAESLFVFIGAAPHTDWLGSDVARDAQGYLPTGRDLTRDGRRPPGWPAARDPFWLETSVPGVFAAGDVRHRSVKRVASAVGEGAMAVQFVHQHLGGATLRAPSHETSAAGEPAASAA